MKTTIICAAAAVALAGCGSSGPVQLEPLEAAVDLSSVLTITQDGSSSVTVSDGTTETVLEFSTDTSGGSLIFFDRSSEVAIGGLTEGGSGAAYIIRNLPNDGEFGASLFRFGPGVLPETGAVTYTGEAAGVRIGAGIQVMAGDVSLDVDFAASTIDGDISNQRLFSSGVEFFGPDIALSGTINGDGFSGTTTGSVADLDGPVEGTFSGFFTGASGEELVGEWGYETGSVEVQGIFVAAQ